MLLTNSRFKFIFFIYINYVVIVAFHEICILTQKICHFKQCLQKVGFSAVSFQTAFYRLSAISRKKADFHGKRLKPPPWDFPLEKIAAYQSEHFAQLAFGTKVLEIHNNYINRSGFYPSSVSQLNQTSPCTPDLALVGQIVRAGAPGLIDDVTYFE